MKTLEELRIQNGMNKKTFYKSLGITDKTYKSYCEDPLFTGSKKYDELLRRYHSSLPVVNASSSNFLRFREDGLYYVDKTMLVKEIVDKKESVVLFNRPRRFGKSLNLSMLNSYFDICEEKEAITKAFQGLKISEYKDFAKKNQNFYPTIFLNFKDIDAFEYDQFIALLEDAIRDALMKYAPILDHINHIDRDLFTDILLGKQSISADKVLSNAMRIVSTYYKKPVIVIIDEYDMPLEKASFKDYFDKAVITIKNLFSSMFKDNRHLKLGVLSGCLRLSKESIFTGLNNLRVKSVLDEEYSEYFGFEEQEVISILRCYLLGDKLEEVREHYDGYTFGKRKIYCPFDVANYVLDHIHQSDDPPAYYWLNTSGNDVLRKLLEQSNPITREEISSLLEGKPIEKEINLNLFYRELYASVDNIYSVMLASGYLSISGKTGPSTYMLRIPNKQILHLFETQVVSWMKEDILPKIIDKSLLDFLLAGNLESAENKINNMLRFSVGLHDLSRQRKHQEAFYHALILGALVEANKDDRYDIKSNPEAGDGYADIIVQDYVNKRGVIIEFKHSEEQGTAASLQDALTQIAEKRYADYFLEGYETMKISMTFKGKICRLASAPVATIF